MRLALISDIHANLEALQAVIKDIDQQQVDSIHCLGDVIGYGCDPVPCLDLVMQRCETVLLGNHEYFALGLHSSEHLNEIARESLGWTVSQLGDDDFARIADFELEKRIGSVHLVHASPYEPNRWHYILANGPAEDAFEATDAQLCFMGHTHLPMIFTLAPGGRVRKQVGHDILVSPDVRYLVNIGSVGQPRDTDPRAGYAIYDDSTDEITYRRVAYDLDLTQDKMSQAKAPSMLIERLAVGR